MSTCFAKWSLNQIPSVKRFFDNEHSEFTHEPTQNDAKIIESTKEDFLKLILKNSPPRDEIKEDTVYTGYGGILFMLLYLYRSSKSKHYLDLASKYANSLSKMKIPNLETELTNEAVSFLLGNAGIFSLLAVYYHYTEDEDKSKFYIDQLIRLLPFVLQDERENEIMYGRAGYLYSCLFVNRLLKRKAISSEIITKIIQNIIKSGKLKNILNPPLMWRFADQFYLGAGHGAVGIIYTLLQCEEVKHDQALLIDIRMTVDWLLSQRFHSGNLPVIGEDADELVHWCHGISGFIPLLVKLYEKNKNEKYLDAAKKGANLIWTKGLLKKGLGLCHGVAGNGYSFLYLYSVTKDKSYLSKAIEFAKFCCDEKVKSKLLYRPDNPYSLFEGISGTCCFFENVLNMLKDENAPVEFPAFDLPVQ